MNHPEIALSKFKKGLTSFNRISKLINQHHQKRLGLFLVETQIPINRDDLRMLLSLSDNVPCNSDQKAAIVRIVNHLNGKMI